MESYGAILRQAREDKKITVEKVERDTTITKNYIEALEAEDSAAFPGEPYLVGFLRNYANYLGLDSAEVIKLYHAKELQESPVPQELLAREKPKFLLPLIISLSLAALIALGLCLYFFVFKVPQQREEKSKIEAENAKIHQYEFDGSTISKRLFKGDQILVPQSDGKGNVVLTVAETLKNLAVQTPAGTQYIDLSEEREIDIDGDGNTEFIIYLSDISATDSSRGAEVRMLLKKEAGSETETEKSSAEDEEELIPTTQKVASSNAKQTLILESNRAYPFTVNISFRGSSVLRYRVDRNSNVEDYYKSGDIINVTASNGVRLWVSNINAMKIQIIADQMTYDLEVGKAGQVHVEDIKWIRDSDGKYRLVVAELD